jgi:hypothetical protein
MARSKKTRGPEELLKSMNESSEEVTRPYVDIRSLSSEEGDLEEMDESAEDVEIDDAEESDPDKTTELDLKGQPKAKKKPAARKPRAPRKKKEPVVVDEEVTAVLEPKAEETPKRATKPRAEEKPAAPETDKFAEPAITAPVVAAATLPAPAPRLHPEADHIREDVSIAAASLHKTMDSMVRQWSSVKEISGSICHELERVNTMLKTPAPQPEPADIKEYLKQAAPRITFANKIALGVSAAAVALSIVSLSLASSTRHKVLEQAVPRVAFEHRAERPAPVKAVTETILPKAAQAAVAPRQAAPAPKIETPSPAVAAAAAPIEQKKQETPAIKTAENPLANIPLLTAPKARKKAASLAAKDRRAGKSRSRRAR